MKKTLIIIGIVVAVIYIAYIVFSPKWTLMICDQVMGNGLDCESNSSIMEDRFQDLSTCLQSGNLFLNSAPSFECGYKCHHQSIFMVCKTVCNRYGVCSD